MKKAISTLLALSMAALMLIGCGSGGATGGSSTEDKNASTEASKIKVGVIYIGDENEGYTEAHMKGISEMKKSLGLADNQIIEKKSIPEDEKCYDAAVDLAEEGCNIIFSNSFGHEDYIIQAAKEYPEIQFCHATGFQAATSGLSNMHNYFTSVYESRYVSGVVAGLKLNKMIEDSKELKIKLDDEKEALNEKNIELKKQQDELGLKVTMLDEDSRDVLEDLADAKKTINNYKKMGCLPTDSLESCSQIPTDSDFLRPLTQGVITSGYGTRENPVSGGYQFHAAVDIGGNPTGTSVYATASGRVVLTSYVKNPDVPNSSCGGNFVVIQHKIGNTYYASRYMHLSKIYVTENQTVTANDIIGAVGGGETYDRCSTGAHLDFSIAQGIYGKDFYLFRQPSTINPFTLVNLPNEGIYFTSRYLRY